MSRPFTFKINAAEFFSVVQSLHHKQRSTFLVQFSTDLITLNPVTDYGKKIVSETIDFIKQQSEYGKTGGKPKHRHPKGTLKAPQRHPKGTPYPKEEVEVKEEKKEKHTPEYSKEFILFWEQYPKKTAKGAAWGEWTKINPPLPDILKALEWQKKSKKWVEGYILDPERYIKRRCWEDEPTVDSTQTTLTHQEKLERLFRDSL